MRVAVVSVTFEFALPVAADCHSDVVRRDVRSVDDSSWTRSPL